MRITASNDPQCFDLHIEPGDRFNSLDIFLQHFRETVPSADRRFSNNPEVWHIANEWRIPVEGLIERYGMNQMIAF